MNRMDGGVVEFDVQCHTPGVEKEAVLVTVSLDGKVIDEMVFNSKVSRFVGILWGMGAMSFFLMCRGRGIPGSWGLARIPGIWGWR